MTTITREIMEEESIERYIRGEMTAEERVAFENSLENNPELAEALTLQKDLMQGIRQHFDEHLKAKFQALDDEAKISSSDRKETHRLWKWAASAAVGLTLVGVFYFMHSENRNKRLYATYYEDFPNIVERTQRDSQSELQDAFIYFQNKQWAQAAEAFQTLRNENPDIYYPGFYLALSLLNLDQPEEALPLLQATAASTDDRFSTPAKWYLALTFLKMDDETRAIQRLKEIPDGSPYATDARALLEQLD